MSNRWTFWRSRWLLRFGHLARIGIGLPITLANPARLEPSLPAKAFAGREPERGARYLESNKIAAIHNQRLLSPALSSAARKRGSFALWKSFEYLSMSLPAEPFSRFMERVSVRGCANPNGSRFYKYVLPALLPVLIATSIFAGEQQRSPFGVQVLPKPGTSNQIVEVKFTVPADCVLYSERLHFLSGDDDELTPAKIPDPLQETDRLTGKPKKVYEHNFNVELLMSSLADKRLIVKFQGCSNDSCFFPEKRIFVLDTNSAPQRFAESTAPTAPAAALPSDSDWAKQLNGFTIAAQQSGYLPAKRFLSFLDRAQSGNGDVDDPLVRF